MNVDFAHRVFSDLPKVISSAEGELEIKVSKYTKDHPAIRLCVIMFRVYMLSKKSIDDKSLLIRQLKEVSPWFIGDLFSDDKDSAMYILILFNSVGTLKILLLMDGQKNQMLGMNLLRS